MPTFTREDRNPPKKPVRPVTYSEDENESPRELEEEPVEVEHEVPATENAPIERDGREERPDPPFFEE